MSIASGILDAGLSFVLLFLIFRPLEVCFPANKTQRFFRAHWWTDLSFLTGQYLFFNGAVFWLLAFAQRWIHAATPQRLRNVIGAQHWWLQAILVVLLGDFLIYWGHRLQHKIGFLWRFHAIHHSAEHLDWLAAHREHPIDSIYTICLVNFPIFAIGFPIQTLAWFAAFRGLWAVFIHANVRLPIGPFRMLIGSPELHHWHHERTRESGNYANVSPLMDLLFGTYRCPGAEPTALGVDEPMPQNYVGQLIYPFWKRRPRAQQDRLNAVIASDRANGRSAIDLVSQRIRDEVGADQVELAQADFGAEGADVAGGRQCGGSRRGGAMRERTGRQSERQQEGDACNLTP